jgi:hypothetical protein
MGNVGVHGSGGGDKGADSPWIAGLQTMEIYCSVKARRGAKVADVCQIRLFSPLFEAVVFLSVFPTR